MSREQRNFSQKSQQQRALPRVKVPGEGHKAHETDPMKKNGHHHRGQDEQLMRPRAVVTTSPRDQNQTAIIQQEQ